MRINVAIPEAHVDAPPLNAALEAVTRLNETLLEKGEVPTSHEGIHKHGVRWRPEPPGDEHFDHAKTVFHRGFGDCDDLAPWAAASLRHTGEDPGAEAVVHRSGPNRWHAVVKRSDGSIDDPSREAGMGVPRGVHGAWLPLMNEPASVVGAYAVRPQIAMRPVRGAFQARADMPWQWKEKLDEPASPTDYAMSTLHTAPVAATALVGALDGAVELAIAGGYADPEHVARLCCLADAVEGAGFDELAAVYGEDEAVAAEQIVGSFFGSLFKGITAPFRAVAKIPFIKQAVSFIPGVGPVASMALSAAEKLKFPSGAPHPAAPRVVPTPAGPRVVVPHPPVVVPHPVVPPGGAAMSHAGPGGVHFHCVPFG